MLLFLWTKGRPIMPSSSTKDDTTPKPTLHCSFCGKSQYIVRKLIAGPTVFICDECVELCSDIVREEEPQHTLTLQGIHLLSMQKWAILPADLSLLQKAVEDGDIHFIVQNFKSKFEAASTNLENFTAAEPSLRRETGIRALATHLLLLLQCAGLLGIKPKEISDEIGAWASKYGDVAVRKAWGELLGTYDEELERRGTLTIP
jgi:hypothetical protein